MPADPSAPTRSTTTIRINSIHPMWHLFKRIAAGGPLKVSFSRVTAMAESTDTTHFGVSNVMTRLAATGAALAGATGVALGIGVLAVASRDAMFGLGAS